MLSENGKDLYSRQIDEIVAQVDARLFKERPLRQRLGIGLGKLMSDIFDARTWVLLRDSGNANNAAYGGYVTYPGSRIDDSEVPTPEDHLLKN